MGCSLAGFLWLSLLGVDAAPRSVVVTIDDLPLVNPAAYRDDDHRVQTIAALCKVLADRRVPATGFFNLHRKAPRLARRNTRPSRRSSPN